LGYFGICERIPKYASSISTVEECGIHFPSVTETSVGAFSQCHFLHVNKKKAVTLKEAVSMLMFYPGQDFFTPSRGSH
jgi:hypothetical protein